MFCGECGTQNPDTNRFCKNCGTELRKPPAAAVPAAPVPDPSPAGLPSRAPAATAPAGEPAAVKPARNWLAIISVIVSLGSWVIYPVILGFFAIVLGICALFLARKNRGNVPVSAVLAIIIGLCAIVLNLFWLDIFPPPEVLPPVR